MELGRVLERGPMSLSEMLRDKAFGLGGGLRSQSALLALNEKRDRERQRERERETDVKTGRTSPRSPASVLCERTSCLGLCVCVCCMRHVCV